MIYATIFGITYAVVAIAVFAMLASKTAQAGANMLNQGLSRDEVDAFYHGMQGKTVLATLQATLITGTVIGALVSAAVWAFT